MNDAADDAMLALLTEVAGTPKPGNVDRHRDLPALHFESFLCGAVGARAGLARAAQGASVGHAFERAVAGMAARADTNTQFGCLLLLTPLVRATHEGALSPAGVDRVTADTTVADAVAFYRAFEHVDVAVREPPPDAGELDVRRGAAAAPALRDRGCSLRDVLALSASETKGDSSDEQEPTSGRVPDRNAQEWVEGFPRTFRAADWIRTDTGPVTDRAARAFIGLLATEPDTLVATAHGRAVARDATARARALLPAAVDAGAVTPPSAEAVHAIDLDAAETLAAAFHDEQINPGTTADLTCAALYIAIRRGVELGGVEPQ